MLSCSMIFGLEKKSFSGDRSVIKNQTPKHEKKTNRKTILIIEIQTM